MKSLRDHWMLFGLFVVVGFLLALGLRSLSDGAAAPQRPEQHSVKQSLDERASSASVSSPRSAKRWKVSQE